MGNYLGLRYITHIIHFHLHHKGFNAVFKYNINLAFLIFQPKRDKKYKEFKKLQRMRVSAKKKTAPNETMVDYAQPTSRG